MSKKPIDKIASESNYELKNDSRNSESSMSGAREDSPSSEEIKFYLLQLYLILKPVIACIFLSILWVKIDNPPSENWSYGIENPNTQTTISAGQVFSGGNQVSSSDGMQAIIIAGIFIGMIIVITCLLVCLFKYGKVEIFYAVIVLSLAAGLGYEGSQLMTTIVKFFNVPLDYITLVFCFYNFLAGGIAITLYKGPLWLQQIYLIILSSLMAFSFSKLPSLATWILLGALAVWDLIAVLCPFGPLKLLIEHSKKENKELPALLYATALWMLMATSQERVSDVEEIEMRDIPVENVGNVESSQVRSLETQDERSGLKLGLGDFVFYSVLVGRSALYDWITTVSCTIAVLSGLTMTIILLVMARRALPALPISIAFGILFYFVSAIALVPFIAKLTPLPTRVQVTPESGLWVGVGLKATSFYV